MQQHNWANTNSIATTAGRFCYSQLQFQLLLNTTNPWLPKRKDYKMQLNLADTTVLLQNPILKVFEQQKQIAANVVKVEKSKLLPDLMIGYNNSSMQGFGITINITATLHVLVPCNLLLVFPLFFMEHKKQRSTVQKFNRKLPKVIMLRGFKICKLKANLPCDSTTSMLKA